MDSASLLGAWASFYGMTGAAAAALTGLMFVVISLARAQEGTRDGVATFSTPTVAHFSAALLISAAFLAPWHALYPPAILTGIVGLCGVGYLVRIMLLTKKLSLYTPDLEDWIFYTAAPLAAYGALLAAALALEWLRAPALFVIAAGVMLLIFVGIRNAWDVVTFLTIERR